MNNQYISRQLLSIFLFALVFSVDADHEVETLDLRIVPAKDFQEVLSDSEVIIKDEVKDETYTTKFHQDGSITSKRAGERWEGVWYTDKNDHHCIRWNHKDTSNCAAIMQDDEGNWVKVKDEEVVKRYKKIKPLSKK